MKEVRARDVHGRRIVPTGEQLEAARRTGLTAPDARRRFRLRTVAECCVYVLCWAALILVSLPADRQAIQWAGFPHRVTTVVQDPIRPGGLVLQWTDSSGGLHDAALGAGDDYALGQQVEIVDAGKCGWSTPTDASDGIVGMIVFMGVLPLAGFAFLVGHRVVTWRRLLDRVTERHRKGYSVSLYKAPWRTFIAVYALGNTYYVPLMRDQRVESLEPVELLLPLAKPKPRAQIPFLVDGTDRVVWPGGGCHTSVWPVGHMVFTVLRVFGPMILIPLTHWVGTSLPPC